MVAAFQPSLRMRLFMPNTNEPVEMPIARCTPLLSRTTSGAIQVAHSAGVKLSCRTGMPSCSSEDPRGGSRPLQSLPWSTCTKAC